MNQKIGNKKGGEIKKRELKDISDQEVEEYFHKEDKEVKLEHKIVKDAMLPVKEYYE